MTEPRFISFERAAERFQGRRVVVVGSGPGILDNPPGYIDGHEIVVRVSNYKKGPAQGSRTDVHFSFYGTSIRNRREDLIADGVTLCMAKCPNSKPIACDWHERNGKQLGIDYRYIYKNRASWWFCDTFVPDDAHYLRSFELLGRHIPTTGFSAILDVLAADPRSVYLTGFDFFASGVHNVDEKWKPGNPDDPICHRPDLERDWLARNASVYPLEFDKKMTEALKETVDA